MPTNETKPRTVAVTGAAGYLGSHTVRVLLERGHRVRAVVRDASARERVGHLQALVAKPAHPLELFSADLLRPGSHDEAFAGCDWICHMASSVRLSAPDPQREIVDVAVEGTRNVLASARAAGTVRRVALTSSVAAMLDDDRPASHRFTEADWNDSATLAGSPYALSKTLAEREAWKLHRAIPEAERFALVALNPTVVFGPVYTRAHLRSSPATARDLLVRKIPACPRFYFNLVDVRDAAEAHARALENEQAEGRYLLNAGGLWMQEMAKLLAPRFPDFPVPTRRLPSLAVYAGALLDKRLSFEYVRNNLGKVKHVDGGRAQRELGLTYRPVERTLVDTCQSFIDLGLVRPRRGR